MTGSHSVHLLSTLFQRTRVCGFVGASRSRSCTVPGILRRGLARSVPIGPEKVYCLSVWLTRESFFFSDSERVSTKKGSLVVRGSAHPAAEATTS
jgi:hypothetical protein